MKYEIVNPEFLPERWEVDCREPDFWDRRPFTFVFLHGERLHDCIAANPDRVLRVVEAKKVRRKLVDGVEYDSIFTPVTPDGARWAYVTMGDVRTEFDQVAYDLMKSGR